MYIPNESFNRTFMELKSIFMFALRTCAEFQSYLYGIEIGLFELKPQTWTSFNRTFMELKCANDGKFKSNYAGFQSYLYGIEIVAGAYNEKPLQRFNRTFMELKSK